MTSSHTHASGLIPSRIRAAQRIWLLDEGTPVFGPGIRELLLRVERTGSLHRAAADIGIAYSKAWNIVRRAEEHLGFPLLVRQAGGRSGGGSVPSAEARELVEGFGALLDEARPLLALLYEKHLGMLGRPAPATEEEGRDGAGAPAATGGIG